MEQFLEFFAEILEVEDNEINLKTDFRNDIEDWDSMKGFAIICMLEDEYNLQLDVPDFLECITIDDLYKKIKI